MNDVKDDLLKPSRLLNILHIYTLSGFVIAFPLYSFLAANPSYFVTNDIWPGTIYLFVATLSVFLPTVLMIFTMPFLVVGPIRESMHWLVHRAIIVVLLSLSFMQVLRGISFLPAVLIVLLAIAIAIFATKHYSTNTIIYIGFAFLSPLAAFFPMQFLTNTHIAQILNQTNAVPAQETTIGIDEKPPIVFVVFDEFPLIDLLDAQGDIDAKRFPNFARFADGATWYANATTVHDYTLKAVPAILSGNYPPDGAVIPVRQNYPDTILTLLENHYEIHSYESITKLSNKIRYTQYEVQDSIVGLTLAIDTGVMFLHTTLPKSLADRIAPMEFGIWGGFMFRFLNTGPAEGLLGFLDSIGAANAAKPDEVLRSINRRERIRKFFAEIKTYPEETLHLIHMLVPHGPSTFLPSGKLYNYRDFGKTHWYENLEDPTLNAIHRRQAHLLQVGYGDKIFGELLDTLRTHELYEKSLVVVVADHGAYYNGMSHRSLTNENIGSVGFVPLFIKYPNQEEGEIDETNVQTIDIVPTITDALDLTGGYKADGRSLIDPLAPLPEKKRMTNVDDELFSITQEEATRIRDEELNDYVQRFSLDDARSSPFHFGPGLDWIGKPRAEIASNALPESIVCTGLDDLRNVDLSADYLLLRLFGSIEGDLPDSEGAYFVVACVNGIAEGVTQVFNTATGPQFDLILSDEVLRNGANEIELFLLPRP